MAVGSYLSELLTMQEKLLKASQRYLARSKDKKLEKLISSNKIPTSNKVGEYV